jgi:hypothetical protein
VLGLRLDVRSPYIDLAQHFDVLGAMLDIFRPVTEALRLIGHSRAVH